MKNLYHTVMQGGVGEIIEKKSRFIATVQPVASQEEAISFIDSMKKKYWNATHNCYAYIIGSHQELQHCSDDGEPSGTAGRPMLDVLLAAELCNIVVVVTRFFGGTLLGTGGLVRAYSKAVQEGLSNSLLIEKRIAKRILVHTTYNGIGKLQYIVAQLGITTLDTQYTDTVCVELLVEPEIEETFLSQITEASSGKAILKENGTTYFASIEKETILFPE